MTKITNLALAAGALAFGLACSKGSSDSSRVLANVGGEKITEAEFRDLAAAVVPKDQLEGFMNAQDPRAQAQRVQLLGGVAQMRAMAQYAKSQGIDQDPKIKLQLESAQTQVYANALLERSLGEPTEAQLKASYDGFAAQSKASGQDKGFPSFEDAKNTPQLRAVLVQQAQKGMKAQAQERLQKELKTAVPMTFADGYQPVE